MKVEKDEFLIDGRKSAMMTTRQRPISNRNPDPNSHPKLMHKQRSPIN